MPVVSIAARRQGTYVLLEAALPGRTAENIGVLLVDTETDRGYLRLRSRFDDLTDDTEVFDLLAADMESKLSETGAAAYLQSLEDSLSNAMRLSDRRSVAVDSFHRVAD